MTMVRFHTVEGVPTAVFPFTTDVPFLDRWGTPLLFGPGSFLVAHTDRECLTIDAFETAIDRYAQLLSACLESTTQVTSS